MRVECVHYCKYKGCEGCSVVEIETKLAKMKEWELKVYKNRKRYLQKYKEEYVDLFYISSSLWVG